MRVVEKSMSTARAERAVARRNNAIPGRIVQLGASKGCMYSGLAYEARLIAYWQLIERAWVASGRQMPSPRPRADLPGEVFEVERNA